MNFTVIDNQEGSLEDRGFRFILDAPRHWDQEYIDRLEYQSETLVDNLFDSFADGWLPVCQGGDGKLYAVYFHGPQFDQPGIWHEVERMPDYPTFSWDQIRDLRGGGFQREGDMLRYVDLIPVLPLGIPNQAEIDLTSGEYICDNADVENYLRARVAEILEDKGGITCVSE